MKLIAKNDEGHLLYDKDGKAFIKTEDGLMEAPVSINSVLSRGGWTPYSGEEDPEDGMKKSDFYAPITKIDEEERIVYGFATVSTLDGESYFDNQGDYIPVEVIRKAFHDFMGSGAGAGKVNHEGRRKGRIVEGMVIDADIKKIFGLPDDAPEGLFIGYKVADDETWERVKKGDLKGFSVGGIGRKKKIAEKPIRKRQSNWD